MTPRPGFRQTFLHERHHPSIDDAGHRDWLGAGRERKRHLLKRESDHLDWRAMIFRLSQKLSTKLKTGALAALPPHDNPFADWSAHLFVADRTQYIMLSNTKSLYSVVMFARGITNDSYFIERALSNIRAFMEADGQEFVYHRFIVPDTAKVRFAKALDRSVTGSMNDLIRHATYWLAQGDISPFDVGVRLNETPMSALAISGSPYGIPRKVFRAMAGSADLPE